MSAAPDHPGAERHAAARAARQLAGYANLLRWSANFGKQTMRRHPGHQQVLLLSPMQSGRFAFCVAGDTILLGVQSFEFAWLGTLPVDRVYVSDRLYLATDGVACLDGRLAPLALGIFVDDERKRRALAAARSLRLVRMTVAGGSVAALDGAPGAPVAVSAEDIVAALAARARARQQDGTQFF